MTPTAPNHEALIHSFTIWLRSWNASPRTITSRQTFIRHRLRAWGDPSGFTPDNIREYLSDLVVADKADWTISTYYTHLVCVCEWLHLAGHMDTNPMDGIRKPVAPKSLPHPVSEVDVERLLSVVRGDVRAWCLLALLAGLRAHEIAKISGRDVQADGIRVKGKGRKIEVIPIHPDLWSLAQQYDRTGPWFPGNDHGHMRSQVVSVKVGALFKSIGIDGSIHRLRHSFVTRLMRAGVNVRQVQKLARHSSLATTAGYAAVDEDELRAAILTLPSFTPPAA